MPDGSERRERSAKISEEAMQMSDDHLSRLVYSANTADPCCSSASLENWHWGNLTSSTVVSSPVKRASQSTIQRARHKYRDNAILQSCIVLPHVEPAAYSPHHGLGDRVKTGSYVESQSGPIEEGKSGNQPVRGAREGRGRRKSKNQRDSGSDFHNSAASRDSLYHILSRRSDGAFNNWPSSPVNSVASHRDSRQDQFQQAALSPVDRLHGWGSPEVTISTIASLNRSRTNDVKEFPISLDSSLDADSDSGSSVCQKSKAEQTVESKPSSWTTVWTPPSETESPQSKSRLGSSRLRSKFKRTNREFRLARGLSVGHYSPNVRSSRVTFRSPVDSSNASPLRTIARKSPFRTSSRKSIRESPQSSARDFGSFWSDGAYGMSGNRASPMSASQDRIASNYIESQSRSPVKSSSRTPILSAPTSSDFHSADLHRAERLVSPGPVSGLFAKRQNDPCTAQIDAQDQTDSELGHGSTDVPNSVAMSQDTQLKSPSSHTEIVKLVLEREKPALIGQQSNDRISAPQNTIQISESVKLEEIGLEQPEGLKQDLEGKFIRNTEDKSLHGHDGIGHALSLSEGLSTESMIPLAVNHQKAILSDCSLPEHVPSHHLTAQRVLFQSRPQVRGLIGPITYPEKVARSLRSSNSREELIQAHRGARHENLGNADRSTDAPETEKSCIAEIVNRQGDAEVQDEGNKKIGIDSDHEADLDVMKEESAGSSSQLSISLTPFQEQRISPRTECMSSFRNPTFEHSKSGSPESETSPVFSGHTKWRRSIAYRSPIFQRALKGARKDLRLSPDDTSQKKSQVNATKLSAVKIYAPTPEIDMQSDLIENRHMNSEPRIDTGGLASPRSWTSTIDFSACSSPAILKDIEKALMDEHASSESPNLSPSKDGSPWDLWNICKAISPGSQHQLLVSNKKNAMPQPSMEPCKNESRSPLKFGEINVPSPIQSSVASAESRRSLSKDKEGSPASRRSVRCSLLSSLNFAAGSQTRKELEQSPEEIDEQASNLTSSAKAPARIEQVQQPESDGVETERTSIDEFNLTKNQLTEAERECSQLLGYIASLKEQLEEHDKGYLNQDRNNPRLESTSAQVKQRPRSAASTVFQTQTLEGLKSKASNLKLLTAQLSSRSSQSRHSESSWSKVSALSSKFSEESLASTPDDLRSSGSKQRSSGSGGAGYRTPPARSIEDIDAFAKTTEQPISKYDWSRQRLWWRARLRAAEGEASRLKQQVSELQQTKDGSEEVTVQQSRMESDTSKFVELEEKMAAKDWLLIQLQEQMQESEEQSTKMVQESHARLQECESQFAAAMREAEAQIAEQALAEEHISQELQEAHMEIEALLNELHRVRDLPASLGQKNLPRLEHFDGLEVDEILNS